MIVSALAGFLALGAIQAAQQGPDHPNHYAGDAACLSCHQAQGLSYLHTAHHLTSRTAGKNSVLGPFEDGKNVLMIQAPAHADAQPGLFFRMEEKNGKVAYVLHNPDDGRRHFMLHAQAELRNSRGRIGASERSQPLRKDGC